LRARAVIQQALMWNTRPFAFTRMPAVTSVRRRMVTRVRTWDSVASGPYPSAPLTGSMAAQMSAMASQLVL
jgi:hypothetical protein